MRRWIVLAAFVTQGCMTWVPQRGSAAEVLQARPEKTLRVSTQDGVRTTLQQPRVAGDSLNGLLVTVRQGTNAEAGRVLDRTFVSLPANAIQGVEVRRLSKKRTALLAVGIVGGGFLALAYMVGSSFDNWGSNGCAFSCQQLAP